MRIFLIVALAGLLGGCASGYPENRWEARSWSHTERVRNVFGTLQSEVIASQAESDFGGLLIPERGFVPQPESTAILYLLASRPAEKDGVAWDGLCAVRLARAHFKPGPDGAELDELRFYEGFRFYGPITPLSSEMATSTLRRRKAACAEVPDLESIVTNVDPETLRTGQQAMAAFAEAIRLPSPDVICDSGPCPSGLIDRLSRWTIFGVTGCASGTVMARNDEDCVAITFVEDSRNFNRAVLRAAGPIPQDDESFRPTRFGVE